MDKDEIAHVKFRVKHDFYYIGYPTNEPQKLWKKGNGEVVHMAEMGLDHLKACIKKVEKDIASLSNIKTDQFLKMQAKQKLSELRTVYRKKAEL